MTIQTAAEGFVGSGGSNAWDQKQMMPTNKSVLGAQIASINQQKSPLAHDFFSCCFALVSACLVWKVCFGASDEDDINNQLWATRHDGHDKT